MGKAKRTRKLFTVFFIFVFFTTCKFTDWGGENFGEVNDSSFLSVGSLQPVSSLRNAIRYWEYIYASDGYGRITVYNTFAPQSSYYVASRTVPGVSQYISNIAFDNRYSNLYLAAGADGMHIMNVSTPSNPSHVASYYSLNALDLSFKSDYIAVIDTNGWKLYYVTNSFGISEIASYSFFISKQPQKIYMTDFWVYVFSNNTLDVFDITNTNNIRWERTINLKGTFIDYTIVDGYLAVIEQSWLEFFDISQPLNMTQIKDWGLSKTPQMMRYNSPYLYISWTDRELSIYKVFSIYNIEEVAKKSFNWRILDVEFQNDYIFLSNEADGLQIFRMVGLP